MRSGTIAFLLGVCTLLWLPALPGLAFTAMLSAGLLAATAWPAARTRRRMFLLALGTGTAWGLWHAHFALAALLPPELEGQELSVEGRVASLAQADARRVRFDFDIDNLEPPPGAPAWRGRVRLSWFGDVPPVRVGEQRRLVVKLGRPHGSANPGGFDYEAWLLQTGIGATGYVRSADPRPPGAPQGYKVERLRETLRDAVRAGLDGHPLTPVVVALAVGDQGGIGQEQWALFGRTGVTHLISISGLHVGMVAALAVMIGSWGWRASPMLAQRVPAPKAAALAGLAAAFLYALLAGFSVPTQRTVVMIGAGTGALWLQRESAPSRVLATALVAVLLYDPFAVFAPGLWLSFGAVAAIFYGTAGRVGRVSRLFGWGRTQWAVTLGLLPATIALFTRTPLLSPLANLFAIPWIELLVVPLTLLGTALAPWLPAVGVPVLKAAAAALGLAMAVLDAIAGLPVGYLVLAPPPWALLAALPGLLWMLAPRGFPARWAGAVWLLPMLLASPPRPAEGALELTLLDVGQGLSAVVRTARHTLVFDTGPALGDLDAGRAVVAPFLRAMGTGQVDLLILSHGDGDHSGGARSLAAELPVGAILAGEPVAGLATVPCRRGQRWEWDGVRFELLHPAERPVGAKINNGSCVLRVAVADGSVLLPGDLEAGGEEMLVAEEGERLASTVLIAPHHGSRTSSSATLVDAVRPRYVLFAVGHRNRWHFPHPAVVERYRAAGAVALRTDRDGAVTLTLGGGETRIARHRQEHARWWRAIPEPLPE